MPFLSEYQDNQHCQQQQQQQQQHGLDEIDDIWDQFRRQAQAASSSNCNHQTQGFRSSRFAVVMMDGMIQQQAQFLQVLKEEEKDHAHQQLVWSNCV
jgi:peroxiredoxin